MLKQIIITSSVIFIAIMFLMYLFQRQLIYFPALQTPKLSDYQANDMQVIKLHTMDGLLLTAWYKSAVERHPTVLYLHGNAGHIGFRMPLVREFINAGWGVLLVEYRGYGGNAGKPSEQGLYEDGRAGLKFLMQQGISAKQLILYGESLGTGVAVQLATEHPSCAVILQAPFTSLPALAHYHYPWLPLKPWDKFNSLEKIKNIHAPLLILHGKEDEIVPYPQGVMLFQQAQSPKKMITFAQGSHNNLWEQENFINNIFAFIQTECLYSNP